MIDLLNPIGPAVLKGTIKRVFYATPKFSAGRLTTLSGDEITFAGKLFARKNEPVVLHGQWGTHEKYGRQFQVESMEVNLQLDLDGLINYLANHPDVKGIGPVKAKLLVDHFGHDFERVLLDKPADMAEVAKVPLDVIESLRSIWQKNQDVNRVMAHLSAFDLTHHEVKSLVDKLGTNVLNILQEDPYIIVREVPGFGFKKVDVIARKLGVLKDAPGRIRAGVVYCVEESLHDGNCWVEYSDLIEEANRLLVMDTMDSRLKIEQVADGLIAEGKLTCHSESNRFLVALPEILDMEEMIAECCAMAARPNPHLERLGDPKALVSTLPTELNARQREAVTTALSHTMVLISGGAGTGKTTSISSIHELCNKAGLKVVLAAPTGKAAKRMEQVIHAEASTIHRLLGYDGVGFQVNDICPLDADVVIVDEVSLLDVRLLYHLLRGIDLNQTSLVLVGDHNQLPPVGPGNPLRDLIQQGGIPTVILDQCVRQSGLLKDNCVAILRGEVPRSVNAEQARQPWYLLDRCGEPRDVRGILYSLYDSVLEEDFGYNLLRDVQLLTPTHQGPLGTRELNAFIQRLVQLKDHGEDVPELKPGQNPRIMLHDKVIMTRNCYDLSVMNGTVGVVVDQDRDGNLLVDFEGLPTEIGRGSRSYYDLQLAYAISIHRAQGSEYPCAIVVVHKSHSFMHHRNLLYTGVTRARETAIILGDRWGIQHCAKEKHLDQRRTFLSFLFANRPGLIQTQGV